MPWRSIDPFYTCAAAVFMAERVLALTGYDVCPDPNLMHPVQINHKANVIDVRPGLSLGDYHSYVGRAGLHVLNRRWFPEFKGATRAQPIDDTSATNGGCPTHHPALRCPRCRDRA